MLRFAVALLAVPALIPFGAAAQAGLSVANYLLASETKISRTVSDFGYRAVVISTSGVARSFLTATVTSSAASVQVIQGNVNFLSVPANGSSTSIDTFTIRVDRSVAFNVANLHWTFAPTGPPTAPALTVGQNLQTTDRITLNSPAATDLTITVVSDDPSKLLFSLMAEAAGTSSIMIGVTAGRTATPDFFVHGLANSGSVTYSISAPGLGMGVGIVDFARSAFVIVGPFGIGQGFITTTGAANTDLTILAVVLDSSGKVIMPQAVRGGLVVNVPAISSNTTVGTITTSPVVFSGGVSFSSTQFDPATFGTTQISITTPSGFSTSASGASLNVTVSGPPPLRIADGQ